MIKRPRAPRQEAGATAKKADADVEEEISDDINPDSELVATRYKITAYGTDFPVDGLVKRLDKEDIIVPSFDPNVASSDGSPGFQRDFVWSKRQSDRFIESLLFGFPVPGVFLFRDSDNRLLVVDGQQRLRTLQSFYRGILQTKEYKLTEVHEEWCNKGYEDLAPSDRRRLDDTVIHATIIRQEEPSSDLNSVYLIFERLNTGGTVLTPQQIRVALYRGKFVDLIRELNSNTDWRVLVGRKSKTLKDQELILRCFALLFNRNGYSRPMKEFLNSFLETHRNLDKALTRSDLAELFGETVAAVRAAIGDRAFRLESLANAALAEAIFTGMAERLRGRGTPKAPERTRIQSAYKRLLKRPEFLGAVTQSTAGDEAVRTRVDLAIKAFA